MERVIIRGKDFGLGMKSPSCAIVKDRGRKKRITPIDLSLWVPWLSPGVPGLEAFEQIPVASQNSTLGNFGSFGSELSETPTGTSM